MVVTPPGVLTCNISVDHRECDHRRIPSGALERHSDLSWFMFLIFHGLFMVYVIFSVLSW